MRNKIQLYIGGERADLDNNSFLLINYTMEELTNPTIVRNSFSKQITLKGTPQNKKIFGGINRNDRVTQYGSGETGIYFDPTRKTSFRILNETGEILEEGYVKLDKVKQRQNSVEFVCTLYGGLGSFLYGLSYDSQGNKRTLADLDFGETLDFTINRDTVLEAWARIGYDSTKPPKWDIINFIPGYHGLPPSPFDANKCLVNTLLTGLKTQDGEYKAFGPTIVTLNEKVTGNAARDYRSYLQKPCIRMKALINAICDPANNGGYTVNKDSQFFDAANQYWEYAWMTLPSLNDLNIDSAETTNTQSMSGLYTMLPIVGGGGAGLYKVTVKAQPYADMMGLPNFNYKLWCRNSMGLTMNLLSFTLTLYDSSQNEIASAKYRISTDGASHSNIPAPDFTFDHIDGQGYFVDADGNRVTFPLYAEANGAAYYKVDMDCENYYAGSISGNPGDMSWRMWQTGESVFTNDYSFDPHLVNADVDITGVSTSSVRTGANITKAVLLGGGHTPADYLLSFCKMFGIQLVCRSGEKVIDLVWRKNFYTSTVKDINGRIDRGRGIEKVPFAFSARWYLFGNDAKGEYAEYYKARYNRPFGQFRVNTGYEFDAQEKEMTKDIVFGNICSLMEASPYFCQLVRNGYNVPSVYLAGGTYLLYNGSETKSMDLPYLSDAVKTWDNPSYPMHDSVERLQFHGTEDAHIDERDTLVFFTGMETVTGKRISLTDDTEQMLVLNGNNPCWMPLFDSDWFLDRMPHFSRYEMSGSTIALQMDWGDPKEIQIPGVTVGASSNVFDQYWGKYIADRYDDDSAVATCYVDFRGMQVGRDLFKQFYAFDGAIWALNKIIDHSLTTSGCTKCEFVKVQDTTNYTTL